MEPLGTLLNLRTTSVAATLQLFNGESKFVGAEVTSLISKIMPSILIHKLTKDGMLSVFIRDNLHDRCELFFKSVNRRPVS